MGHLRGADYYNDVYTRYNKYTCHYKESVYYPLWKRVLELLIKDVLPLSYPKVLEVGCGTGQFAHMLYDNGIGINNYLGFDFSEVAVYTANMMSNQVFFVGDALKPEPYNHKYDTVISLEVFEHTDDMKILENIPSGKNIIISVPDFDDPAHIRYFVSNEQVRSQYEKYIQIEVLEKLDRWYILKGVKK